jgi:hypothetical protein
VSWHAATEAGGCVGGCCLGWVGRRAQQWVAQPDFGRQIGIVAACWLPVPVLAHWDFLLLVAPV